MKPLEQIIIQKPVYLEDWAELKKDRLIADFYDIAYYPFLPNEDNPIVLKQIQMFTEAKVNFENINILFAYYSYKQYEGEAWVLFEQNGLLFEVNGSHCSCYGLENQWQPEPVLLLELENRLTKGSFGTDWYYGNTFANELKVFLGIE